MDVEVRGAACFKVLYHTLHNKLYLLYSSPNIWVSLSRRARRAGHVACVGDSRGAYRVLLA